MAQGDKTEQTLTVATVEHKEFERKSGGKGELWKVTFVGGVYESSTFSKTCAEALKKKLGTPLVYSLTGDKPYNGQDRWKIDRVVDPTSGEVVYEPSAEEKARGGGGKGGGYSRPDWSYEDEQERLETRLSIEAQKALDLAVQTLAVLAPYDDSIATGKPAVAFVSSTQRAYATLLRESVDQKSGSGSRHSGAGGRRQGSGSRGEDHTAPDAREPSAAAVPSNEPSPPTDGLPTPEPGSSSSETMADIEKALTEIDALTGSRNKTLLEYKRVIDKPPVAPSLAELARVKADLKTVATNA